MSFLNGPEIEEFAGLLSRAYNDWDALSGLLLSINQGPIQNLAGMYATIPAAARQIVSRSNDEGWAPALLIAVQAGRPQSAEVQAFFARYPGFDVRRNPHLGDFWQATQLFGGDLFMGRADVRTYLKRMTIDNNRKVLQITGETHKIGKSYTCSLVSFVSEKATCNKVTYIELDKKPYDLRKLANELAEKWKINPADLPKQDAEQEPRWAQSLASALVEKAEMPGGLVRWLILDGFGACEISSGIKELIDGLALKIKSTGNFRLILMDYNPLTPLPLSVRSYVYKVAPLTRDEIKETFASAHLSRHGTRPENAKVLAYMDSYDLRLAEYKATLPEHAASHLVIHHAAADVVEEI